MAAVLGVNLGKTENLRISQWATVLFLNLVQIFNLLGRQCQTLLLVVFLQVINEFDRLWLNVNRENVLIQTIVHTLQHGVVLGILRVNGEIFLNALNALQSHVLGNFYSIGRPRGHHLTAWTNIVAFHCFATYQFCLTIEPAEFLNFAFVECMVCLRGNHTLLGGLEKENHIFYTLLIFNLATKLQKII